MDYKEVLCLQEYVHMVRQASRRSIAGEEDLPRSPKILRSQLLPKPAPKRTLQIFRMVCNLFFAGPCDWTLIFTVFRVQAVHILSRDQGEAAEVSIGNVQG